MHSRVGKLLQGLRFNGIASTKIIKIAQANPRKSLAVVAVLFIALSGLAAWQIQAEHNSTKASGTPDSTSSSVSTLNISSSTTSAAAPSSDLSNNDSTQVTPNTQVTVDGQPVTLPNNGSTHRSVNTDSGDVNVSIQGSAISTSTKSGHSYQNLNVHTNSNVNTSIHIDQQTSGGGH